MGTTIALLYDGWALLWPFYTPDGHYYGPSIRRMGTAMVLLYAGWAPSGGRSGGGFHSFSTPFYSFGGGGRGGSGRGGGGGVNFRQDSLIDRHRFGNAGTIAGFPVMASPWPVVRTAPNAPVAGWRELAASTKLPQTTPTTTTTTTTIITVINMNKKSCRGGYRQSHTQRSYTALKTAKPFFLMNL